MLLCIRHLYCLQACLGLAWLGSAWLGLAWLGFFQTLPERERESKTDRETPVPKQFPLEQEFSRLFIIFPCLASQRFLLPIFRDTSCFPCPRDPPSPPYVCRGCPVSGMKKLDRKELRPFFLRILRNLTAVETVHGVECYMKSREKLRPIFARIMRNLTEEPVLGVGCYIIYPLRS